MDSFIILYVIDVLALVFLLVLVQDNNLLSCRHKSSFSWALIFTVLVILCETGSVALLDKGPAFRGLHLGVNTLGFFLAPFIPLALMRVFDGDIFSQKGWLLLPSLLNGLAVILSPFFGLIFYINAYNDYMRGDFFFLFVLTYLINVFFLVGVIVHACQQAFYPIRRKIGFLALFTLLTTSLQILDPQIFTTWHSVTLVLFLFFVLLSDFNASFDLLTSLHNRASFDRASKQLTERSLFSVAVLDLNDFKKVSDNYGQEKGDLVLKEMADIIRASFDQRCVCYRTGRDEFSVLGRQVDEVDMEAQLTRLSENLSKTQGRNCLLPSLAYGQASHTGDQPLNFKALIREANKQMQHYKACFKGS